MYVEEAIQAALESRWQDALTINRALVERHGTDDETCNRLGKALAELGEAEQALEQYSQALQLDPMNVIAQKNVRKLQILMDSRERLAGQKGAVDMDLFAGGTGEERPHRPHPAQGGPDGDGGTWRGGEAPHP